jgi:hypothetical protein
MAAALMAETVYRECHRSSLRITAGVGTVLRITADGSSFSVLHMFAGGTSDGGAPNAVLIQGTDGAFYGTT